RPPATAKPSQKEAAECSLSGSTKTSWSPHRLGVPLVTAWLNPPPMVVELVIGYAPEPWEIRVSTQTIASAPSHVVGIPGYWNLGSITSWTGMPVVRSSIVVVAMERSPPDHGSSHFTRTWEDIPRL